MTSLKSLVGLHSSIGLSMKFMDADGFEVVVYPNTMRKLKKFIRQGRLDKYHQALIAVNPEKYSLKIKFYDNSVARSPPPIYTMSSNETNNDALYLGRGASLSDRRTIMEMQDNSNSDADFFYEKSD